MPIGPIGGFEPYKFSEAEKINILTDINILKTNLTKLKELLEDYEVNKDERHQLIEEIKKNVSELTRELYPSDQKLLLSFINDMFSSFEVVKGQDIDNFISGDLATISQNVEKY